MNIFLFGIFGTFILGHLVVQNDELRSTTVDAIGNLSKQCSDVDAVGKLIEVIGDVFYSKNTFAFGILLKS